MKFLAIIEVTPKTVQIQLDEATVLDAGGQHLTQECIMDFVLLVVNPKKATEEIKRLWEQNEKEIL